MVRIAINGFGRIGRAFFRATQQCPDLEVVAINDLGDPNNLAYLLQHDSVFGMSPFVVSAVEGALQINDKRVVLLSERDPEKLPWTERNVDVVIEATGVFDSYAESKKHLTAGAKRVLVTAPIEDDPAVAGVRGATILMGVNDDQLASCEIISNASCTTNAVSPLIAIMKETIGIDKAVLNTVHAYTATQSLVDSISSKDFRRGRAASLNIVPSATGAGIATTKAHTELEGKFDGLALRVPVAVGSIVDLTFIASRSTSVQEVNEILKKSAQEERWKELFAVTNEPLVSTDIIGARVGSLADLTFTRVVGGNLVKVLAWYDNESSYTQTLIKQTRAIGKVLSSQSKLNPKR